MNARLENRVLSARRVRRNRELDRADSVILFFSLAAIVGFALMGWL